MRLTQLHVYKKVSHFVCNKAASFLLGFYNALIIAHSNDIGMNTFNTERKAGKIQIHHG